MKRKRRNVYQGFYNETGFHPIRSSYDYDPDRAENPARGHRLKGWTAIRYAEKHGGTLKKFTDPIERALERVSIEKAKRVASEDPRLIYMDVKHGNQPNPARKRVSLKDFTGTITRNADGTVSIKGKGK